MIMKEKLVQLFIFEGLISLKEVFWCFSNLWSTKWCFNCDARV